MSSIERQKLILKKMQALGLEVGSGVPNKEYDKKEVYELIQLVNCFPELGGKNKKYFFNLIKFFILVLVKQ